MPGDPSHPIGAAPHEHGATAAEPRRPGWMHARIAAIRDDRLAEMRRTAVARRVPMLCVAAVIVVGCLRSSFGVVSGRMARERDASRASTPGGALVYMDHHELARNFDLVEAEPVAQAAPTNASSLGTISPRIFSGARPTASDSWIAGPNRPPALRGAEILAAGADGLRSATLNWAAVKSSTVRAEGRWRSTKGDGTLMTDADATVQLARGTQVFLSLRIAPADHTTPLSAWLFKKTSLLFTVASAKAWGPCMWPQVNYFNVRATFTFVPWSTDVTPWRRVVDKLASAKKRIVHEYSVWGSQGGRSAKTGLSTFCLHGIPMEELYDGLKIDGTTGRLLVRLERFAKGQPKVQGSIHFYTSDGANPQLAPQLVPRWACARREKHAAKLHTRHREVRLARGFLPGTFVLSRRFPSDVETFPRLDATPSAAAWLSTLQTLDVNRTFEKERADGSAPRIFGDEYNLTNPAFVGDFGSTTGRLVVRYTNMHACTDAARKAGRPKHSVVLSVSGGAAGLASARAAPILAGTDSFIDPDLARGCMVNGLEDVRSIGPSALIGSMSLVARGGRCIASQVLMTPQGNRVLHSPTGVIRSEKNWVAFGDGDVGWGTDANTTDDSKSALLVYMLFDSRGRTVFMRCTTDATAPSTTAEGLGEVPGGCRLTEAVHWDVKLSLDMRSSSNWVHVGPQRMLAIAHQGRRLPSTRGPNGEFERGDFEYVSRLLEWDLAADEMRVHKPSVFHAFPNTPLNKKTHVEFVTGLRPDASRRGWVWVTYGHSDCEAHVARFRADAILAKVPVEFVLKATKRTSFPARIDALEMQEIFAKHSPSYGIYEEERCEAAAARKNLVPATLGKGVKGARLISGDKFMMQEMQSRQDLNKYGVPRTGVDSLPGAPCAAGMERGCIPRLIHQFAYEATLPLMRDMSRLSRTWMRKLHAPPARSWTIVNWRDEHIARLIDLRFPQLSTVWRELPGGVWRSDVGRYLILAAYGGWYSDTDVICELALDEISSRRDLVLVEQPGGCSQGIWLPICAANFFIGSVPRHPFWEEVLTEMVRFPLKLAMQSKQGTLNITGFGMLSRAFERYSRAAGAMPVAGVVQPGGSVVLRTKALATPPLWLNDAAYGELKMPLFAGGARSSIEMGAEGYPDNRTMCYHVNLFSWSSRKRKGDGAKERVCGPVCANPEVRASAARKSWSRLYSRRAP